MSSVPLRLALFTLLLAATFGAAAALGGVIDPDTETRTGHADAAPARTDDGHGGTDTAPADGGHAAPAGARGADEPAAHDADETTSAALPGLAVAQDGYRLALTTDRAARGRGRAIAFRILDDEGRPVRSFDLAHGKRMHVIVVRRDLTGFQHVHPALAADGTWRTTADLPRGGTWRVYADFTVDGEQHTLGADLQVPGDLAPRPLPAPATTARSDRGATVALRRDGDRVTFTVRDATGADASARLQPYLDAKGHLVALRAADLAYLHTHPEGDSLAFEASPPSAGAYRLFVQFRLDGVVHTAAFTEEVTA